VNDHVIIRIPPATAYVGLIRAMASGLAARLDFTYDQIMDLHIAIDEVCSRLLDTAASPEALEFRFGLDGDQLAFEATADGEVREDREFLNPLSRMILEALVDRFDVSKADGTYVVRIEVQRTSA
jgi:serine/threonine-protein kinase RsbW